MIAKRKERQKQLCDFLTAYLLLTEHELEQPLSCLEQQRNGSISTMLGSSLSAVSLFIVYVYIYYLRMYAYV